MIFTLDNRSQNKESSLTQALLLLQQLNSKIQELEQQHQDYVHKQQNLIRPSLKFVFLRYRSTAVLM